MKVYSLFFFLSIGLNFLNAQEWYSKPDFSVQYISYFGIGSESVQKPSVLGNYATNYARMQQALPNLTGQGLGIPVYFYRETLKNCGADQLINKLWADFSALSKESVSKRLTTIRKKIKEAIIPKMLLNQLNNAINEFYIGKKIRLSASPNYQLDEHQSTKPIIAIVLDKKDLAISIAKLYASFWEVDAFYEHITNKQQLKPSELALGLLLTEAFEYGYAIGRINTNYKTQTPSIEIMSKREKSTERIGFSQFNSKWYRIYQKAEKDNVFVANASLTPTVRALQRAIVKLDPILRSLIPKFKEFNDKAYKTVVTFIIIKQGGNFYLRLQQPELQLAGSK